MRRDYASENSYRFSETSPVTKGQRRILIAEAKRRIQDPNKQKETIWWILDKHRIQAHFVALCKRWGMEIEDTWAEQ